MRKHPLTLTVLVLIATATMTGIPAQSLAETPLCELSRKDPRVAAAKATAVRVHDYYVDGVHGVGSGTVIGPHEVLTNAHVTAQRTKQTFDPKTKSVTFVPIPRTLSVCIQTLPEETCYPAEVVMRSTPPIDLAILRVKADFTVVARLIPKTPEEGDCMFSCASQTTAIGPRFVSGSYLGLVEKAFDPQPNWIIDMTANRGGSGSPVFDGATANFIGILVGITSPETGRSLAIVIPSEIIRAFLQKAIELKILPPETLKI